MTDKNKIIKITRGTKKIITDVIKENNEFERHKILCLVCECLVEKFKGKQLEYQLKRMNLETTSKVLEAIDYVLDTTVFN